MRNNKLKPKTIKNTKFFRFYFLDFILSRKANGFTLIETLIAITVLSLAVVGPMTLSINSVKTASVSRDKLTAFYLGQEAIEYIRNVRDTNFLTKDDWFNRLKNCKTGCYVDVKNDTVTDCGASDCPKLKFDSDLNYYNYQPVADKNKETNFTRTVKIDNSTRADGYEAKIDVTVSWTGKYGTKTMKLQDNIFNWIPV